MKRNPSCCDAHWESTEAFTAFKNRREELLATDCGKGYVKERNDLPIVAGRMEMTHKEFQQACRVLLAELQANPNCDNSVIRVICEAVRCSRECCDLAKSTLQIDEWKPVVEAMEFLWTIICNVSNGDWRHESRDWRDAAARGRADYYNALELANRLMGK